MTQASKTLPEPDSQSTPDAQSASSVGAEQQPQQQSPGDTAEPRSGDGGFPPHRSRIRRVAASAGSTFDALRLGNYRIYFAGSLISNIGVWMQRVAQDWFVLELAHGSSFAGLAVGITTALQFLPILLVTPYAGLLADRIDKRKVLWISQAIEAVASAALGLLAIFGVAQTWHVFALAFCFGIGVALGNPARKTFVYELAGPQHLSNAVSLNSASFNTARMIGPAIAGLMIAAFGSGWAILVNALSYLPILVALMLIDESRLYLTERTERAKHQLRAGVRYILGRADVMVVLCTAFFVGTFGLKFQMTSALMARQVFHRAAGEYGILGTILAVGSLSGALISARRKTAPRLRFVVGAAVVFAIIEIVTGMMPGYASYAALLPLLGISSMLMLNASNVMVQIGVDPKLRGRVMGIYMMLLQGGSPIGAPVLGWIASTVGARWTMIGGGGIALLGTIGSVIVVAARTGIRFDTDFALQPRPRLSVSARQR